MNRFLASHQRERTDRLLLLGRARASNARTRFVPGGPSQPQLLAHDVSRMPDDTRAEDFDEWESEAECASLDSDSPLDESLAHESTSDDTYT